VDEIPDELRVFSVKQVAVILDVGRNTVEAEIRANRLRARFVGNRYRIRKIDLEEYIAGVNACDVDKKTQSGTGEVKQTIKLRKEA
jgi:excisionase family DNA binding protein